MKYLEWLYAKKKEDLLRNILSEIRSIEKLTEENYKLDKASLSDLLSLKAEALRVEREIKNLMEERRPMKAEIDSLVGKSMELKGEEPTIEEIDLREIDEDKSPYLRVVWAEVERLKAEVERRKGEYLPDLELVAEYMIRPVLDNMFSLRTSVSLPLRRSRRENLMVLEKLEDLKAKEQELEKVRLQVKRDINSLRIEEERIRELQSLTEELRRRKGKRTQSPSGFLFFWKGGL
ncbi:MAG: TolC family protein [Thermosphaera sp.]